MSEVSFFLNMILALRTAKSHRQPNLNYSGARMLEYTAKKSSMRHKEWTAEIFTVVWYFLDKSLFNSCFISH